MIIGIISGAFDPLHRGHVRLISEADRMCEHLIVGLNSDDWLRRTRKAVFMGFEERKEVLQAVRGVQDVWDFDDSDGTACALIRQVLKRYSPNSTFCFFNGGDRTLDNTPELDVCLKGGVQLVWGCGGGRLQSSRDLLANWEQQRSAQEAMAYVPIKTYGAVGMD